MKELNEYTTGYPVGLANNQSQEYQGVLGPYDAETVQGNDRFNLKTPEGTHRLNGFINHFFRRTTLNPHYDLTQLKARLNHLNLDFKLDAMKPLNPGRNVFKVTKGEVFGVTPTTDLTKGFDTGSDLPVYILDTNIIKVEDGFKIEAQLLPYREGEYVDIMEEKMKNNRNKRISLVKELLKKKTMKEQLENRLAKDIVDVTGTTQKEMKKDKVSTEKKLKSVKR
jgi:hypothetical protein